MTLGTTMRHFALPISTSLLILAACASRHADTNLRDELAVRNAPRREATLASFAKQRVGDRSLLHHARAGTAWIVDGATSFEMVDGSEPGAKVYRGIADGKVVTSEIGAAAAISTDGYFLTAAHCIGTGRGLVIGAAPGRPARECDAVLVWSGKTAKPPVDLAVVWAPGLDLPPFAWSTDRVAMGTPILVSGSAARGLPMAGGEVVATDELLRSILVDVPLLPGDSGGPCVLADGTLLGVVSTAMLTEDKSLGRVLRPDPAWLEDLLTRDRATRATQPRPTPRVSTAGTLRAMGIDPTIDRLVPTNPR